MATFTLTSPRARLGFRGRVFRGVLAAVLVVVLGFVFLEAFLFGRPGGEPAEETEVDPAYHRSRPWQVVVDQAAAAIPTGQPPPDSVQRQAPERGRLGRGERPSRSRAVSWNLNQEGMGQPDPLFHDGRVANPWPGCALKPGQYLEAVLLDRVDSELAGSVNARVTASVSDVDGYGRELVPAGSIVIGRYKHSGGLSLQRRRLDFAWDHLQLPDGNLVSLAGAEGADASGAVGVGGEVTTNWGNIFLTTLVYAVLDAGQRSAVSNDASFARDLQASTAHAASRTGQQVVGELLSFEPRIVIPGATVIRIKPKQVVRVC
jgi:type IV secretory pathway VirB10-like protein